MTQLWKTVLVAEKTREAEDVISFELIAPDRGDLTPFTAGSHVDVEIEPGLIRQYSLCNDPRERGRYLIGVLREVNSRGGSVALTDRIEIGSNLRISDPRNHFALEPSAKRVLLLAGGIGVTPILCMAEHLAQTEIPFEMHYCARSRSRAAFRDRILGSGFSHLVHFHFDQENAQLDINAVVAGYEPGYHLYVCGPQGFIDAVLDKAISLGWPASALHREFFAASLLHPDGDRSFEVEIASTRQRFRIPPDKSVADVLIAQGLKVSLSCEQGICGACITRVIGGIPDHRDMILNDEEKARNDQFTPCCSRAKSAVLVLDL